MRLNINHLEMIVAIADSDTLSAAARRLNLTQPALSYRVREAERRLGLALFTRTNNRLRTTPAAARLCLSARRILAEWQRAEADLLARDAGKTEIVRIGLRADPSYRWLPRFIADARGSFPEVDFEILPRPEAAPLIALNQRQVDLEIIAGRTTAKGVAKVILFEDELVAVLPVDHPLGRERHLAAKDFQDETYVTYSATPEAGLEDDLFFTPQGIAPARFMKIGLVDGVIEAVRAGLGVTILSRAMLPENGDLAGLALRPLAPTPIRITWCVAYRRDHDGAALPRLAQAMAAWCRVPKNRPAV